LKKFDEVILNSGLVIKGILVNLDNNKIHFIGQNGSPITIKNSEIKEVKKA
jgi:hypothetical protein